MRFCQLDQITHLEPGKDICAKKLLTGKEDYLRDHFPRFAVMPGVLMLEALYQASALLVRATDEYKSGMVILRTAKNVKFADFVQPGQTLEISAQIVKREGNTYVIKGSGRKGENTTVTARLIVECIPDQAPAAIDRYASQYMRQLTDQLQEAAMACG